MSQCHWDLRALVGSAFAWRRATGEREARWRKRGVSLVSGIIVVSRVSQKSAPQELPTRVTHKSVPQECPTRRRVAGERDDWWYYVICLLLVCGRPLQRCADTARNAPVGAPEPQRCAAVLSAHRRLHPLTSVHTQT